VNQRLKELDQWLQQATDQPFKDIRPASSDASFRRYFRVTGVNDNTNFIVMDAPPDKEDCTPFIHVTHLLHSVSVNAPDILAYDKENGFLLLSDLGDQQYLDHLTADSADQLYADAISSLVAMQKIENNLPEYNDQRLREEMQLFETWYLNKHLDIQLDDNQKSILNTTFDVLVNNALEQPKRFVHRDYHSRNLMKVGNNNPGIIDYQDAVTGPVTYDLVSLFKDCYIKWPRNKIETWLDNYLVLSKLVVDQQQFLRWFDLMGVQRHLKVLGIFSRLNYRDGKTQFMNDLPMTLGYIVETCQHYAELDEFHQLLQQLVLHHPKVATT